MALTPVSMVGVHGRGLMAIVVVIMPPPLRREAAVMLLLLLLQQLQLQLLLHVILVIREYPSVAPAMGLMACTGGVIAERHGAEVHVVEHGDEDRAADHVPKGHWDEAMPDEEEERLGREAASGPVHEANGDKEH
eukprot:jgi/Bigna1/131645/aug1.15_g6353